MRPPRAKTKTEYSGISVDDLGALVGALGMSSRALGRFLGVDDGTVRGWLRGDRPPPIAVVMTLELMRHFKLTPEQVREITGEESA